MARLCRILTAVLLAVHLMVGCCAHHAHACDGQVHSPLDQGDATPDGECPDGHSNTADHSHHGSQDCQGGKCTFVLRGQTNHSFIQPMQALAVPLLDDLCAQPGIAAGQRVFSQGRFSLPVRLHLANQVLLI
jgi:hypothetical protein